MNFLAIATLKNDRACFRLPISIRPLRSLKFTFDSERTGIAMVGSLRFSAAAITRSATPTSFFSTAVGFRGFLAIEGALPLLLAPGARLRCGFALRLPRGPGFGRRRRRHRLFGRRRSVRRHDRHLAFDTLRRDDDRMRSEEHTSELQSLAYLVCRLLLEKKNTTSQASSRASRALPERSSSSLSCRHPPPARHDRGPRTERRHSRRRLARPSPPLHSRLQLRI